MGIALWTAAGLAAWAAARAIRTARRGWGGELSLALLFGLAAGVAATVFDFGGWNEPDWRAGLFSLFVAFAAVGAWRSLLKAPGAGRSHPRPDAEPPADQPRTSS